jgi:F-type H+-transporting ATPase subunit delta
VADNASLARPYAKAVFSLAEETSAHEAWEAALARLSAISADEDFAGLVSDPRFDSQRLTALMVDLAGDDLPAGGDNFINLLVQNDRVEALASIHAQYTELVARAKAQVNAEVITAMPLNDEQRSLIADALEHRLGLKVNLEETVDASLIGGAIIKAGDMVVDGSAKGRIEKLSSALLR